MSETQAPFPNDGGSAFPLNTSNVDNAGSFAPEPGMTLRDWFAGQALASLGDWTPNHDSGTPPDWTNASEMRRLRAEWSYKQADAMLAARKGGAA